MEKSTIVASPIRSSFHERILDDLRGRSFSVGYIGMKQGKHHMLLMKPDGEDYFGIPQGILGRGEISLANALDSFRRKYNLNERCIGFRRAVFETPDKKLVFVESSHLGAMVDQARAKTRQVWTPVNEAVLMLKPRGIDSEGDQSHGALEVIQDYLQRATH